MDVGVTSPAEFLPGSHRASRWRAVGALFDHWTIQNTFGVVLPLIFVFGSADLLLMSSDGPYEMGGSEFFGLSVLGLTLVLALIFGVWALTGPFGRELNQFFAVALSLGSVLSAYYAAGLGAIVIKELLDTPNFQGEPIADTASFIAFGLIPLVTCIVFFRAASRAWAVSGTRAAVHPERTMLWIVFGLLGGGGLIVWILLRFA